MSGLDYTHRRLEDRNRWLDHYHGCPECAFTAGFCEAGLDLAAAVEASMSPDETLHIRGKTGRERK